MRVSSWVLYPRDPIFISLLTTGLGPFFPPTPSLCETDYSNDATHLSTFNSSQLCLPEMPDHRAHSPLSFHSLTREGQHRAKEGHTPPPLTLTAQYIRGHPLVHNHSRCQQTCDTAKSMASALLRKIILSLFTSIQLHEHLLSACQRACSGVPPPGCGGRGAKGGGHP